MAFVVATGKGDGSIRVARAFGVGWVPGKGDFVRVATNFQYAGKMSGSTELWSRTADLMIPEQLNLPFYSLNVLIDGF